MPSNSASLFLILLLQISSGAQAWSNLLKTNNPPTPTTRHEFFRQAIAAAAIVAAPAVAGAQPFDPNTFAHQYTDPKHPNCKRIVQVSKYGNDYGDAKLAGTDGNPGCPEDGSGNVWRLNGDIVGDRITVDFSPKGGPANLRGVWDPTNPPGIRWPDGNKWTVKS